MKYQRQLFKNIRNGQLLISINFNLNDINQIINDHFLQTPRINQNLHLKKNLVHKQYF